MGSSIHRLEILLIGAMLLIAGSVAVAVMLVRPPTESPYSMATAVPVATATTGQPTSAPAATAAQTSADPPAPVERSERSPLVLPAGVTRALLVIWPLLLLTVGGVGLALTSGRIVRRRRMAYTGQHMGMLLATADATTRASNLRVLRDLEAQGQLPPELAAAAGLATPRRFAWPALKLPALTLPALPQRRLRRTPRLDRAPIGPVAPVERASAAAHIEAGQPLIGQGPDAAATSLAHPLVGDALLCAASAAADSETPKVPAQIAAACDHGIVAASELERLPGSFDDQVLSPAAGQEEALPATLIPAREAYTADWSADDRALAVAAVLADMWATDGLVSPVLAIDTATKTGAEQVIVSIDAVPDEDERLTGITTRLAELRPTWRANWRASQNTATMAIEVHSHGELPCERAPLIAPVLHHGRGTTIARYYPLTTWRHLGLYGGDALPALHALLMSLLYMQPPSAVALSILDQGQISPLFRDIPHVIPAPGAVGATVDALNRALRRSGAAGSDVRPLLLVVVEPDMDALVQLTALLARLRQQSDAPVHLLLVQERLHAAGRELYAMLPALITAGGQGAVAWLPGQGAEWPKRGTARLTGRGMRIDGRPITLTEAEAASLLTPLRHPAAMLPPVLWELVAPAVSPSLARVQMSSAPATLADIAVAPAAGRDADPVLTVPEVPGATPPPAARVAMEASDEALPSATIAPALAGLQESTATDSPAAMEPSLPPGAPVLEAEAPVGSVIGIAEDSATPYSAMVAADALVHASNQVPEREIVAIGGASADAGALADVLSRIDLALATPRGLRAPGAARADGQAAPATDAEEPENGWPCGPKPIGRADLAVLMGALTDDAEIMRARQADQIGITKKRLQVLGLRLNLFPEPQARTLAEQLIVWFDQASVLVMPLKTKEHPLNQPRALERADLDWIRERLNATPLPGPDVVRAAWATTTGGAPNP